MKAWRRACSQAGNAIATGPSIIHVFCDGGQIVVVQFDDTITVALGGGASSLIIAGDTGTWLDNPDPDKARWQSNAPTGHSDGELWTMNGPEPVISPTPLFPESGTTESP